MPDKFLIYSNTESNRLHYTMTLVFEQLLGLSLVFTQNKDQFLTSDLPKLAYSTKSLETLFVAADPILFETTILNKSIKSEADFFSFTSQNCDSLFPDFDPFARIFYLVSRYEEYNLDPSVLDAHGRFSAANSLAQRLDFLHQPIVNQYVATIERLLKEHYPNLKMTTPIYQFQPTFDIDQAWQVRNKGFLRNLGGGLKELIKGDFQKLKNRLDILRGAKPDPFSTFDYIFESHKNCPPIAFWLLGDYARFDVNISPKNVGFQRLIQTVAQKYAVGLHPSYRSNTSVKVLQKEKKRLESILKKSPITNHQSPISRQHFLKLRFPETYRRLLEVGIQEDWSLGYADAIGFRASIATPFYWFDLEKNETTQLKIHPFQVMDVTLKDYLKLNPNEAFGKVAELIATTKAVGGQFVTLWHNDNLSDTEGWFGWREVYEKVLELAKNDS